MACLYTNLPNGPNPMRRRTAFSRREVAVVRQLRPFTAAADVDWPRTVCNRGEHGDRIDANVFSRDDRASRPSP
jgi:hypothetical protein